MAWTPPEIASQTSSWQPPEVDDANNQDMAAIGNWADSTPSSQGNADYLDEDNSKELATQAKASGKPAVPLYHYNKNNQDIYSASTPPSGTNAGSPNYSPVQHNVVTRKTPSGLFEGSFSHDPDQTETFDTEQGTNVMNGASSKLLEQALAVQESQIPNGPYRDAFKKHVGDVQETNSYLANDPQGNFGREVVPLAEQMAMPGSTGVRGAMAIGGLVGALNPVSDDSSQAMNAVKSAGYSGGGYYAGKLLGKIAQPIANELDDAQQAALGRLKARGFTSDLAQETGNPTVTALKQSSTDKGMHGSLTEKQNSWFAQQAAGEAGITKPTDLSREDIQDQMSALGLEHKAIYTNNPVTTNMFNGQLIPGPAALGLRAAGAKDDLTSGIEAAYKEASQTGLPSGDSTTTIPGVLKLIQKFTNPKTGVINPKTLAAARSALGGIQADGTGGEVTLATQVADMLDHHTMEQAFQRGGDASTLPAINTKLQNLYSLRKATQNGDRDLTPQNWLPALRGRQANDPAYQLADDGATVMANNKPNRIWQGLLGHVGTPAMIGAAYGAMHGDWKEAAKYGLIAGALPAAAGLAIRNQVGKGIFSAWADSPIREVAPKIGAALSNDFRTDIQNYAQTNNPLLKNAGVK